MVGLAGEIPISPFNEQTQEWFAFGWAAYPAPKDAHLGLKLQVTKGPSLPKDEHFRRAQRQCAPHRLVETVNLSTAYELLR